MRTIPEKRARGALAAEHADEASKLLRSVHAGEDAMRELSEEDKLAMRVGGGMRQWNANIEHTIRLASAHALTAAALMATGGDAP